MSFLTIAVLLIIALLVAISEKVPRAVKTIVITAAVAIAMFGGIQLAFENQEEQRYEEAQERQRQDAQRSEEVQQDMARQHREELNKKNKNRPAGITMAQYNQVLRYMSYYQVEDIMKRPGTKGPRHLSGVETYTWSSDDGTWNMVASFVDGELTSKDRQLLPTLPRF